MSEDKLCVELYNGTLSDKQLESFREDDDADIEETPITTEICIEEHKLGKLEGTLKRADADLEQKRDWLNSALDRVRTKILG